MNSDNYNENGNGEPEPIKGGDPGIKPILSPVGAAIFALIGIFILYQFGGGIITYLIFGMDLANADLNALRLMTMGGQIVLILFPTILFARIFYDDITSILRYYPPKFKDVVIFIFGLVLLTPLLQSFLILQNFVIEKIADWSPFFAGMKDLFDQMDKLLESTYESLMKADSGLGVLLIVLVVAVVPAVCEETFFRGYVQRSFELKLQPVWAAVITAFFFSLYHFSPYGFPALFILGLYIGFSAYMSNSIFIPMILHFINNLFAVILYFVLEKENLIETGEGNEDIIIPLVVFIVLSLIFAAFIIKVKNHFNNREVSNDMPQL